MKAALQAQIAHMEWLAQNPDKCFGQPTGFIELDKRIGGMADGDLIIIGARPSAGKSTLAMNIVEHAASSSELPWLVCSLEMPTLQLTQRMISFCGGVNFGSVKSGNLTDDEWVRYTSATARLMNVPITINDKGLQTLPEIRRQTVALKRKYGKFGGLMIDYIGLMGGIDQNNKVNSIGVISAGLKSLAKELSCPVIALSQLNRGLEQRPNKRPVMSDLRESGAIEQDADIIMFIYRDEVYNPNSEAAGTAEIIVAKQRNGALGTAVLGFEGQYSRFTNLMGSYQGGDHE
jgi:replicative DNA helicase